MITRQPELPSFSPEFRLVAYCSWLPNKNELHLAQVADLVASGIDWSGVAYLVIKHGVVGSFCHTMGQLDWAHVPTATKDSLKSFRRQQAVRALAQVAEISRVCSFFEEAGIMLIPLKGVALSQEIYGDPSFRSSCDIDILVHLEDVPKAEDLLIRLGYRNAIGLNNLSQRQQHHVIRTEHHHEYINDKSGVHIELHWRSSLWNEAQTQLLWEGSLPSKWIAGGRQLSKIDNILFLADHGAKHGWQCLKWLSDLAMLMENCSADEWDVIYARAAVYDLGRVLLETSLLMKLCYNIELSANAKTLLAIDETANRLAIGSLKKLNASSNRGHLWNKLFNGFSAALRLKQLKPTTSIITLLRSLFIIRADFVVFPLPDSLFWLYLPLRPLFWAKRHFLK